MPGGGHAPSIQPLLPDRQGGLAGLAVLLGAYVYRTNRHHSATNLAAAFQRTAVMQVASERVEYRLAERVTRQPFRQLESGQWIPVVRGFRLLVRHSFLL